MSLKDLKEYNPAEVVNVTKARCAESRSASYWWVPHVLRKRDLIMPMVASRTRKNTHKCDMNILANF